jgi:hypothetical protein
MIPQGLKRWDVLNELLAGAQGSRYLEIGVQRGQCGARIRASEKWGVDPEPLLGARGKYSRFFQCTSDVFFADLASEEQFDVIFIDGLHHAEQTLRDAENSLKHLAPGGTIVLHDCNPPNELAQRVPRETGIWNGDCWKAMVALRQRPDVKAFTIDADEGLGILTAGKNLEPLQGIPAELSYSDLEADRGRLLGLMSAAAWQDSRETQPLGRIAVVSAIFGGRDAPLPAPTNDADSYVMFTDGPGAEGWRVERMPAGDDPRRAARKIKTLALELVDADTVVWVDGRIRVMPLPLRPLLRPALRDREIAGYPHPWRRTAKSEAAECDKLGLAPTAALAGQIAAYAADGFPDAGGLWNTMVIARRNTPGMRELGRAWWQEIERHSVRDQVSLPYVLWKQGVTCGVLGRDVYRDRSSAHFRRGTHLA